MGGHGIAVGSEVLSPLWPVQPIRGKLCHMGMSQNLEPRSQVWRGLAATKAMMPNLPKAMMPGMPGMAPMPALGGPAPPAPASEKGGSMGEAGGELGAGGSVDRT